MWQRFTERARQTVFFAQEEAQKLGDAYVSTEHLLLGLVRPPDSVATRVLSNLNVNPEKVKIEIEMVLTMHEPDRNAEITLTPRAKRVIDLAYDEARNLANTYIGTEHLLLGLIREGDGVAGRILAKLGVDIDRARNEVRLLQNDDSSGDSPDHPSGESAAQRKVSRLEIPRYPLTASVNYALIEADRFVCSYEGTNSDVLPRHLAYTLFHDPTLSLMSILKPLNIDPDDVADKFLSLCNLAEARANKSASRSQELVDVLVQAVKLHTPPDSAATILAMWEFDQTLASVFEETLGCDLPTFREKVQAFWDANPSE